MVDALKMSFSLSREAPVEQQRVTSGVDLARSRGGSQEEVPRTSLRWRVTRLNSVSLFNAPNPYGLGVSPVWSLHPLKCYRWRSATLGSTPDARWAGK